MRSFLFLFLYVVSGAWLLAQQPAPSPAPATSPSSQPAASDTAPSAEQVAKLLHLLRVRDEMQITVDAMKQQIKGQAEQEFSKSIPNPTTEQLKSVSAMVDEVFTDLSLDDLIKALVPIYQRHLTASDVRALIAFYSSPPGQKILREQPAMIKESMRVTGPGQQKKIEALLAKLDVRMQQLIDQEQNKTAPDRK